MGGFFAQTNTALVDLVAAGVTEDAMESALQQLSTEHATSWTRWRRTVLFFVDTLDEGDAAFFHFDLGIFKTILQRMCLPEAWSFLRGPSDSCPRKDLTEYEKECHQLEMAFQQSWNLRLMPRQFGRHRILLHAFSGRRRVGDVQFFLEQFAPKQEGYVLHVVSMDIINDPVLGDAMNEQTRQFWVQAVRMRHVVAFLGGPPCESWSYARGKHVEADLGEDRCGPRILRDVDQLWGFSSVSLRELS